MNLLFELRGPDGEGWMLYEDGIATGFPDSTVIVNRAKPQFDLLRGRIKEIEAAVNADGDGFMRNIGMNRTKTTASNHRKTAGPLGRPVGIKNKRVRAGRYSQPGAPHGFSSTGSGRASAVPFSCVRPGTTIHTIQRLQRLMRDSGIAPEKVSDRACVARLNRYEKNLSDRYPEYKPEKWRVGERYYLTHIQGHENRLFVPARAPKWARPAITILDAFGDLRSLQSRHGSLPATTRRTRRPYRRR